MVVTDYFVTKILCDKNLDDNWTNPCLAHTYLFNWNHLYVTYLSYENFETSFLYNCSIGNFCQFSRLSRSSDFGLRMLSVNSVFLILIGIDATQLVKYLPTAITITNKLQKPIVSKFLFKTWRLKNPKKPLRQLEFRTLTNRSRLPPSTLDFDFWTCP